MGKAAGLQLEKPLSYRISKAYLRWHKVMPLADLATLIPRKYFNSPKSFIVIKSPRRALIVAMSCQLSNARITSST